MQQDGYSIIEASVGVDDIVCALDVPVPILMGLHAYTVSWEEIGSPWTGSSTISSGDTIPASKHK